MSRHLTIMRADEVAHISADDRARLEHSYPAHESAARLRGEPSLGSGRVFPLSHEDIAVTTFQIPNWWPCLGAIDFGWTHPTAAVMIAYDRENDVIYLTRCYRKSKETPAAHAQILSSWGRRLPWAWPHDGLNETAAGPSLAQQYRDQGLIMLPHAARSSSGGRSLEASLLEMFERMTTGRFKVFSHFTEWFEEFRLYHRRHGRVVAVHDDLLSASRYAVMMRRYAKILFTTARRPKHAQDQWDPLTKTAVDFTPTAF